MQTPGVRRFAVRKTVTMETCDDARIGLRLSRFCNIGARTTFSMLRRLVRNRSRLLRAQMNNQETQKLRNLLAQRQWAPAVELLRKADPTSAADFFLSAPYDEQRALFHAMPVELAASLIVHLPYYHAYVLLHSLPSQEMRAVVEAMTPGERNHFLDALPEEAWQCLMDELAEAGTGAPYCAVPDTGTDAGASDDGVRAAGR